MANNSSPTLYLNLESVAPESAGAAVGPVVTLVVGEFATTSIGPTTTTLITAASEALGPVIQADASGLVPEGTATPTYPSPSGNLIIRCDSAEFRINSFEWNVDSISTISETTYRIFGISDGFSNTSTNQLISRMYSAGTILTSASGLILTLPSGANTGETYTFRRASGPVYVVPTGNEKIWDNNNQISRAVGEALLLDSQNACVTLIAISSGIWLPIHEYGSISGVQL